MDYEDLISNDYCLDKNQYYDKKHYAKFNTTEIALTKACGLCKNHGHSNWHTSYWSSRPGSCNQEVAQCLDLYRKLVAKKYD